MADFSAKIICDSINPAGVRIVTAVLTYPRDIMAELNTHRVMSRNAASSRAIPTPRMIAAIDENPKMPVEWGKNQPGMQATQCYEEGSAEVQCAKELILAHWEQAKELAMRLSALGLHKQIVNRYLEPWMWATTLLTTTDVRNFIRQRAHPDAEPSFRKIANAYREALNASTPTLRREGDWHIPFGDDLKELPLDRQLAVATGRCARVSYLTHDGVRDMEADVALHDRLVTQDPGHWSPLEHIACARADAERVRNFRGWEQYRCLRDANSVEV